jgi:putative heme-binding domain-containing protein
MKTIARSLALLFAAVLSVNAERVPWTTSRITGSPEAPALFVTEPAFPKLNPKAPLELVPLPGTDRLVLAEHAGWIYSFPNRTDIPQMDVFAHMQDLNPEIREVFSVAFHPGFLTNRFVYIFYILKPDLPDGTHISRFKLTDTDPPKVDLSTEKLIITWLSGGHNGGCIRFGPDGYMYLATGDAASPSPPDPLDTGQDLSDLLSSILRIDVDHPSSGRAYSVPPDNPFINTPGARPEIWAYGFRNPWRMSFDFATGALWAGDVGWELWEMIYRVERGGNYGWSVVEGTHQAIRPNSRKGPTPILPPVIEHSHSEAASITGGYVYHGKRFPELQRAYIYGDWETGKIWELLHDGKKVVRSREIADTPFKIVSFGEDRDGELYILDYNGTIHRLVRNPRAGQPSTFPRKLSETGLFTSVPKQKPAPGVRPYSINAERWADFARAERWLAFPDLSHITNNPEGKWMFPPDAVLAKTYSLEMRAGEPSTRRRIETQLLHFNGEAWNAYSYAWNPDQTDAVLVDAAGKEEVFEIHDTHAPGGKRHQTWRFHGRAECLRCHNPWCNTVLGFDALQLRGGATNTLEALVSDRFFAAMPTNRTKPLVDPHDTGADLNARARSYLHVNCSPCHRENAGGSVLSHMNYELRLEKANLVGAKPLQGLFGIPDAQVVCAGDPYRSVLLYRIAKMGKGHMPYLGSALVDERGVRLLEQWIAQLDHGQFNRAARSMEQLLACANTADALALSCAIGAPDCSSATRKRALSTVKKSSNPLITDLFERFLPDEQRRKTLGGTIRAEVILALQGDVARGRKLFSQEGGAQCHTCHVAEKVGREFGPDLNQIGKKYAPDQLLEHIVNPSLVIDPQFSGWTIETASGETLSGLIKDKTERELVFRDAQTERRFKLADVKRLEPQKISLMPDGLLQGLTPQEAADLLAYLESLK